MRARASTTQRVATIGPPISTALVLLLPLLTACTQATNECLIYAEARITMPRPLPDNELGEWVAVTDSRFTAACR